MTLPVITETSATATPRPSSLLTPRKLDLLRRRPSEPGRIIVNDVTAASAIQPFSMLVAAGGRSGMVLMHMRGDPSLHAARHDAIHTVVAEVHAHLLRQTCAPRPVDAGIDGTPDLARPRHRISARTTTGNLALLAASPERSPRCGHPVVDGTVE